MNDANAYQPNFVLERYLGKWYEMARSKNIRFEKGDHTTAEYARINDERISVVNTEVLSDGTTRSATAYALPVGDNPAHINVYFSKSWFAKLFPGDYRVVATNYDEYAIVYSYSKLLWLFEFKFAWILSRNPQMTPERVAELLADVQRLTGIVPDEMRLTKQD